MWYKNKNIKFVKKYYMLHNIIIDIFIIMWYKDKNIKFVKKYFMLYNTIIDSYNNDIILL